MYSGKRIADKNHGWDRISSCVLITIEQQFKRGQTRYRLLVDGKPWLSSWTYSKDDAELLQTTLLHARKVYRRLAYHRSCASRLRRDA